MTTIIRAVLVSATLATYQPANAAEGEYYDGAFARDSSNIDTYHTSSVGDNYDERRSSDEPPAVVNSGDYWSGAVRPN